MIASEFGLIVRKMHAAYNMLNEQDDQRVWFNALKEFDYTDVDVAVTDFVYANNRRPTIADIVDAAKRNKRRRTMPTDIHRTKLVKCPYCHDTGLVVTTTPTGVVVGHACTECGMGRVKHPWDFLGEEEREKALKEEERQGLKPPRDAHEAPEEYYMWYCYGVQA